MRSRVGVRLLSQQSFVIAELQVQFEHHAENTVVRLHVERAGFRR